MGETHLMLTCGSLRPRLCSASICVDECARPVSPASGGAHLRLGVELLLVHSDQLVHEGVRGMALGYGKVGHLQMRQEASAGLLQVCYCQVGSLSAEYRCNAGQVCKMLAIAIERCSAVTADMVESCCTFDKSELWYV